ncbi:hypothetical protein AAGS61_03035 [Lysinibacillus sp. KU-BSD001]|uniref:hypothetical protein n=1 Tax=Lysinibacillus sp. KU-BSD001 TaxID=3141328 RepID=UPI0036EF371E
MAIGMRVYYDNNSKKIIHVSPEYSQGEPLGEEDVRYFDVPYGSIDFKRSKIIDFDIENKKIIVEEILSDEEKKIRELEDALLLQTDSEIGGIL